MIFRDIQTSRLVWHSCLDFILKRIFSFHIGQDPSQNFGDDGIFRSGHGSGRIFIFRLEETEKG